MNEEQMLDKESYQVSIDEGKTYNNLGEYDTVTKVNERKVEIYVKELEDKNDSAIEPIKPYVKIAPIMDLAGNKLYDSDDFYIVEEIEPENVCIEIAELIAKNKIRIEFNKKMVNFNKGDIELTNLTTPGSIKVSSCESITINPAGNTEVVLTLNKNLSTDVRDEAGVGIGITTIDEPSLESESGSKLRSYSTILNDKVAPEIVKWDHDNDESTDDIAKVIAKGDIITIYFSEDIWNSDLEDTFEVDGFTISDIKAPYETKTVILTVETNDDNTPINTIIVNQVKEIYDRDENVLAPGSSWEATILKQTT